MEGTTCTRSRAQGGCEEQDGLGVQVFQEGDQERQKKIIVEKTTSNPRHTRITVYVLIHLLTIIS